MANMSQLLAAVTAQRTVVDGIVTLIADIRQRLIDAGATEEQIDTALAGVEGDTARLAAALTENTPSEPPVV